MKISPKQAIDLEIKLNKTIYSKEWIELGDILYKWRIDPTYYQIENPLFFNITKEQMEWITKNIIVDKEEYQCYQLSEIYNII
jgi:hypothetical protein